MTERKQYYMISSPNGTAITLSVGPDWASPENLICEVPGQDHATFIVKACNRDHLFGELLATLIRAKEELEDPNRGPSGPQPTIDTIEAVLAKAQED